MTAAWSSPDARGVVRNLTAGIANAALHPPVGSTRVPSLATVGSREYEPISHRKLRSKCEPKV